MRNNIYDDLNKKMIKGSISKYNSEGIVELIKIRYSKELLKIACLDSEDFFNSTFTNLNEQFFLKLDYNAQKELACTLLCTIKNYYCQCFDDTPQLFWFVSAVIHLCFIYLKESEQQFRDMFCTFDINNGINESFCRLVIISETEKYCACLCNDVRKWHEDVIKFDGDAFESFNLKENQKIADILCYLWFFTDSQKFSQIKVQSYLLFINFDTSKSIYWSIRKACNLL